VVVCREEGYVIGGEYASRHAKRELQAWRWIGDKIDSVDLTYQFLHNFVQDENLYV